MKVNGKSKTPITAAQAKKKNGEEGGTKARASQQTSKRKINGIKTAVLDRISDGVLAFDAGMNCTYLNDRAGELLGRNAKDLIGKNLQEEYSGAEQTPFLEACQRALETQSVVWLNEYFPPADRWLEGRVYPSEDGVSVLFTAGSSEKAEQDRARMLAMFPQQNPAPVMRLTGDAQILYANQAATPLLEAWKQEGSSSASLLKIQDLLPQVIQSNTNRVIEIEGAGRVFSCQVVPFQEEGYANIYFSDITERKQVEETLRAIVNQSSAGITRADPQGRLIFVNQAFCDMLGYSAEELTRLSIWDITDRQVLEKNRHLFERLLATGEGYQLEKRLVRRNGSMVWVSVGTMPLRDADGHIRGVTAVVVDITRRKRAEESLLDSARRSLFLSSLSDTLRSFDVPAKIQVEATCLLGAHLKASRVVYAQVDTEDRMLIEDHYTDEVPEMEGSFSISDFIPQDQRPKFTPRRPLLSPDIKKDPRFSDSHRSTLGKLSVRAQMIVPFTRENKLVAVLLIQQSQPRMWKDEEVSLVEEAAERMQTAIERAQAEDRLRDSEKRFRILANAVPSIVWTSTPEGALLYVNNRWHEFTGIPRQAGTPLWTDLKLHPEDAPKFFQVLRVVKMEQKEAVAEVRIQRHDGAYRWFQTRSVPTRDEEGNIIAWHGVLTEIHDRVEKENEQREVVDSTPFMLTRCSRDLRYRFVSRAYAEMIGRTPEEVNGKSIVDIMGEEGLNSILPYVERVLQGEHVEYEGQVHFESGNTPYLHVAYTPDRDEQGDVIGWFASIIDITERRQMEENLRESEHKFNIIFHKLPFTAILLRPEDSVIVDINEEFETVFGFTRQDAIGRTTSELGIDSNPGDRAYILAELQAKVAIRDMELQFHTKSHGLHTFLINTDLVNIDGTIYVLQTAQDITERREAEREAQRARLQAEHETLQLRTLLENLPVGVMVTDPAGKPLLLNRALNEIWLGSRPLETLQDYAVYRAWSPETGDLIDPEDWPISQALRTGETQPPREMKIERFDGTIGTMLSAAAPIRDHDGRMIRAVAVAQDITDRKQIEQSLAREREMFKRLFETMPVMSTIYEPETGTMRMNAEVERLTGWKQGEVAVASLLEALYPDPDYLKEILGRMAAAVKTKEWVDARIRTRDGRMLDTLWANISLTEGEKLITGISLGIDITERKRAEEALRASEEKYRRIVETANEGIWEIDRDARTVFANARMAEMLGYTVEEMIGRSSFEFVFPEDYMEGEKRLAYARHGNAARSNELRYRRKDGSPIWGLATTSPQIDEQGNFLGSIAMIMDITERKRAEQELAEFARQQEALFKLADELSSAGSLEEMFNPALDAILNGLRCDRASILLFDQQDVMSFVAWRGLSDEYRRATNGHSPWTRAEKNARPISLEDVATADLGDSLRATIQAEGIGALAFIPLISRGNLIGKFMVYYNQPHIFEEAEIGLAQTISHQLASHIERKQAAEDLRQSKQRLSLAYHHAPIGIVETTLDGRFLEVNNELCRMLGYSYDELLKLGIADVTHRDDLQTEMELYRQLVSGEIPFYRMEKRFLKKDGNLLWGEIVRTMLYDENGSPLYGIGGVLNITERKQREEEIRARTEEIEALMEVSPIGIFVAHDPQCIRITGNPAGYHLVEMPEDSTQNISKSAPEHERPTYRTFRNGVELKPEELPMQAAARLGMEIEEETLELRFENGSQKYIYSYAKPLFDALGNVRGAIAAMLDITESRRNEQALRESEERFTSFMHHLPGLAWIKDMQGRYVFANAAAQKAFNVSQEELYGKTDWEIFPQATAAQFNRNDDLAIMEEKGLQVVETLPQADGVVHHSLVTKFPIPGPDGRQILTGGTAFDITERIQMEDALRVARTQAEITAYRVTQLQKITAALSQIITPSEIARMVVEQCISIVGAAGGSIMLLDEETQNMEMIFSTLPESVARPFARFPLSLGVPTSDAARLRQPIWIASREEYLDRYPHLAESIQNWGLEGALVFPMVYKGKVLGTLSLSFSQPLPFSSDDQEYLLTLARQAAQAFERARIETALRLDAAMMENVPAGVYLVRASDGVIIHSNPQLDKLFGYEPGEIIGKPISTLDAENTHSPQEMADWIVDSIRREGSWQGEILGKRKDGTTFWCYASITTFEHDIHGTVWVAARQDITERKQIEEALGESEQRYRAIVSQATAGIVRKDHSGRLLFINQAFCDMLGMSESELKGRRIWELTHPDDVGENKRLYNRLMAEGIPFQLEKRVINKQGRILWMNVSVSPVVDLSGRPRSAVSVYVDITGRKLAEKRLSLLVRVSELAREFEDPDELMYAVAQAVGEHFQARRTLFNEIDLENNREIIHRDYCIGAESAAGEYLITDYSSITTAEMVAGKTVVNQDSKLDPRTAADYDRSYVKHGERSYIAVPLMHDNRWVASLWISDDKPRDWDREDVSLLETIAERTWIAIEKLKVDRALRDSEERLRVTFNTTAVGFATLTPDTHFIDVNNALCQIVGYSREELLAMDYDRLIHPGFSENTKEQVALLIADQIPSFTIEKIFIRRDGTEIWVQSSISLVRDAEGRPIHLIVICQDVTERKRSEKALQESNQRYQTLVEISPYAIFVNKDGRIVFANNECVRLLGAESLEQVIGRSNFDFLHPDYHDIVRERNTLLMQGHQDVPSLEEKIIRFDGEIVDVEISASPFIEQGEPAILVTMNNIAERKRAEEALHQLNLELEERVRRRTIELQAANEFLRESEATSRLILESMPDAIVIINRDGQIVHANTQVETLFGYAPGEVMGQPVETLVPQRLRTEHEKQRSSYAEERNRRIMGLGQELFGRRKDESEFPVEVMLAPIDNSTNWDVLVAIRDNTRQRQAQEALRTNEEKLRTLFEILPVGISFLGKDGRVNELNSALAEILDLPRREILAGSYRARRFIRADGSPMPASEFASTRARMEQKTIYNVETGIVKENGEIIWTSVNAAPVQVADVEAAIVTIDITERKKAEEALHKNRERLRILSRRLVEVQEEERHAIARELHDRVGQNLAALTLNLNILRNQLSGEILEKVGTRLNDSVTLVNDVLAITRSVMADLRPNVLDDYGLDAAINEYAERFTQRYGIRVITHTPAITTPRLDPGIEMTLLRIAQEALTNIAKHAQASQAFMTLEMEEAAVLMTVEDNGQGILSWQKVNQPGSHGLRIMRERAEAFGGSLKIHSTYKNGTKIEVKIPLASRVPGQGRKEKKS